MYTEPSGDARTGRLVATLGSNRVPRFRGPRGLVVGTLRKQQSPEYRVLRDELLAAEAALKDQRERPKQM